MFRSKVLIRKQKAVMEVLLGPWRVTSAVRAVRKDYGGGGCELFGHTKHTHTYSRMSCVTLPFSFGKRCLPFPHPTLYLFSLQYIWICANQQALYFSFSNGNLRRLSRNFTRMWGILVLCSLTNRLRRGWRVDKSLRDKVTTKK